ncbi:MAG: CPBP family glutamic-type intramembrane protease [Acidobacteriota bacterium]|nr:CPBP family glutamic-type intramembrane protease [Acidobacteriota bacterium]
MKAKVAWIEMAAMTAAVVSFIWLWSGAFPGSSAAIVVLYFGIPLAGHLRRGETPRDLGLRLDNFGKSLRDVLVFVGPLVPIPILIGGLLGSLDFLADYDGSLWVGALQRIAWSTAQQYALVAFFYRRSTEVVPGTWPPIVLAAGIFGLVHLPNPFLTVVTFLLGSLSCWLYRRVPNVFVLGLAHAVLSFAISRSLPVGLTFKMRVGPGFLEVWERLYGFFWTLF